MVPHCGVGVGDDREDVGGGGLKKKKTEILMEGQTQKDCDTNSGNKT